MLDYPFLKKKLIFVSGKGGVGKTTISLVIAELAKAQGLKPLLVEFNSLGRMPSYFDKSNSSKNGQIKTMAPDTSWLNLKPKQCFEEYVLSHVKFKGLYSAFFTNKYVSHFIEAVPGLSPILMLGKLFELKRDISSDSAPYDFIIVDSPATGHGLSLFEIPKVLEAAVKIGPLHRHASDILNMLEDQNETGLCLVTLAEEMPVVETIEFTQALANKSKIAIDEIFINGVFPKQEPIKFSKNVYRSHPDLAHYMDLAINRSELHASYVKKVETELSAFDQTVVPYQFEELKKIEDLSNLVGEFLEAS